MNAPECHVSFVIGRRASGKSSMLSKLASTWGKECLILVNTKDNAEHHIMNTRGVGVILLESSLEHGELPAYCSSWNASCLLIDDANGTSHDAMLTDALELAKSRNLSRLVISLNHPLMAPLSQLSMLGCNMTIDVTMLSHYDDPLSVRIMQNLNSTYPVRLELGTSGVASGTIMCA